MRPVTLLALGSSSLARAFLNSPVRGSTSRRTPTTRPWTLTRTRTPFPHPTLPLLPQPLQHPRRPGFLHAAPTSWIHRKHQTWFARVLLPPRVRVPSPPLGRRPSPPTHIAQKHLISLSCEHPPPATATSTPALLVGEKHPLGGQVEEARKPSGSWRSRW